MKFRTLAATVALTALTLGLAACGPDDSSTPQPSPAPRPLPVTALRPLGYTFTLADDPDNGTKVPESYKVTYMAGSITLRDKPRVTLGFRVDPAHPDQQSELLKTNVDSTAKAQVPTTPVTADGGAGISFTSPGKGVGGVNQVRSVIAKGATTVTVNVDADPAAGGDAAAKALHDQLVQSLKFHPEGLADTWPGIAVEPQLPATVDVPADIARDSYESELATYFLELTWGKYTSVLGVTWQDTDAAVKGFADTKANLHKAGVRHQNDVKTLPALKDSLGPTVDEGFAFQLAGADGIGRYVGVLWRKGGVTVRSSSNIGNIPASSFTAESNAALATPMGVAQSWTWAG